MFTLSIVQLPAESAEGGTLRAILDSFPTDPAALFALGLSLAAVVAVVMAGRGGRGKGGGTP